MSMKTDDFVYDCIGVGFGPANMAMAIATREQADERGPLHTLYLEARDEFTWHPGMLFEDSRLQVVFLKDLVTMCNPRSRYTFINYLHEVDRLHEFINLRALFPTRIEFNEYYRWVARQFDDMVRYNQRVIRIEPVSSADDGEIDLLRVISQDVRTGETSARLTRNMIYGDGGRPRIPAGVETRAGGRVVHSSECLTRLNELYPDRTGKYRFAVVGSGQTAADILYFLLCKYPNADVTSAMRRFAFKPQDDTHYVNELFFPRVVDLLFELPDEKRRRLMDVHRDVTHSAVDMDLIPLIYDIQYNEKVSGRDRPVIRPFLKLSGAKEEDGRVTAVFENLLKDTTEEIEADLLILGTGYDRVTPLQLLGDLQPYLRHRPSGSYEVERFYAIAREAGFRPKIYLQGYAEETHGFSEVLLSILPVRAAEIVADLRTNLADEGRPGTGLAPQGDPAVAQMAV